MLGVSGTTVWALSWVSPTPETRHLPEPSPDSMCFPILSDTNSVFPMEAWMGAPWGMAPLTHCGCPHTLACSGDARSLLHLRLPRDMMRVPLPRPSNWKIYRIWWRFLFWFLVGFPSGRPFSEHQPLGGGLGLFMEYLLGH